MGLQILKNLFGNKTDRSGKGLIFWTRLIGLALPLIILGYFSYINYLPFGYSKAYVINIGANDDTKISEFYLEPSRDMSERKVSSDGQPYRELNGMATAIFKPKDLLRSAKIDVEVIGDGISLIPPQISFNPSTVDWSLTWNFAESIPESLINVKNKTYIFDRAAYFDGTARLELASSSNMLEYGPFTAYVEWMPTDATTDGQQIMGHFNWELWQNKKSVTMFFGRMNNKDGDFYKIELPVEPDFFNNKHTALAVYSPSLTNGYVDLYIDGKSAGRKYLGPDQIWTDYGGIENLSFGWTPHNDSKNPHFKGFIYFAGIANKNLIPLQSKIQIMAIDLDQLSIPVISANQAIFKQIKLNVTKK
jgi:hypothetical protein